MGQVITDYVRSLADARDVVYRPNCDQNTTSQLADEEEMKERESGTARKAVSDSANQTIKKRLDEINPSYDQELGKGQERLKKTRVKRGKAKSQKVKGRIAEETSELREYNRDLKVQIRTLFQKNRVPAWCGTTSYYTLYYPRDLREIVTLLLTLVICFLGIPCGIYFLIPQRVIWYLAAVYSMDVPLLGGPYMVIDNKIRLRHQDTSKRRRGTCNHLRTNQKKIEVATGAIQGDDSEDLYDLERYDDEITYTEQGLSEIASRRKDTLSTFENVTKTIISDEIIANYKDELDRLRQELDEVSTNLRNSENSIREQNIRITDTYGPYLGKGFL